MRKYIIIIICIISSIFIIDGIYKFSIKKYKEKESFLQSENKVLTARLEDKSREINDKEIVIKKDKEIIDSLNNENNKLKSKIENLKQPTNIERAKTDEEYINKVDYFYHEKPIIISNGFELNRPIAFTMMSDAEKWLVNGPVLEVNLNTYKEYCDSLEKTKTLQGKTIQDLTILNNTYVEKDALHIQKEKNQQQQIDGINKELKAEKKRGILSVLKTVVYTAVATYITERAIEHRKH